MIIPPALAKGDTICLIATARKIDVSQLTYVEQKLNEWGLKVVFGKSLKASRHQLAGTDEERACDLQEAINSQEIKAILCFRGGYGTVRILGLVDFTPLLTQPKWICGYSDVTAIHNVLNKMGIASLHSTMPVNFRTNTEQALWTFKNALFGNPVDIIDVDPHEHNREGIASGRLVGGNLSMLYSLSATPFDLQTEDCILFLEDLDEYLYHIDRMIQNFKLAGKLKNIRGLVVGGMTDMNDNEVPFGAEAEEIIAAATDSLSIPVAFGFPAGHLNDNRSLVLGMEVTLEVTQSGASLRYIQ